MRRFPCILAPMSLVLLLASCGPADRASGVDTDRRAVENVFAELERANNAGDVDAWMALFADDPVYMAPRTPTVTTREGLRRMARRGFSVHRTDIAIEPEEVRIRGDWAFARAVVTGRVVVSEGDAAVRIENRELAVLRRRPGSGWKLARLMINRNG